MPEPTVAEARVLAALDALGWEDDRESIASWPPPGNTYELMSRVIAAADAAGPRPSQGQSIPEPQLEALRRYAEMEAGLGVDDPVEQVARAAYAVGYAAALGHRITVGRSGAGLLIGDRVDVPPESARP